MTDLIKKIEEQISFMQQEISQMSDEIFIHQKEISKLTIILVNLKNKLNDIENNIGIRNLDDDTPPPHY